MNRSLFLSVIGFGIMCIIISSCTNTTEEQKENIANITQDTIISTNEEIDNIEYTLPSAGQISVIFKRANLKYVPGITTNINNDNVGEEFDFSVRLGIYSADLFYLLLNNQWAESEKYFLKCQSMANKLGISDVFTSDILKRLKTNIQNADSITKILSIIQYNTDNKVQSENKEHITHIAFAGAWIESMYISVKAFKKDNSNLNIPNLIGEQVLIGNTLLKILEKDKKILTKTQLLIDIISDLMYHFNNLQSIKQTSEDDVVKLSQEDFELLSKVIETSHQKLLKLN